jgi:hypothetical protein
MTRLQAGGFTLLIVAGCLSVHAAEKMTADELVKRHLAEALQNAALPAGQIREVRGAASVKVPAKAAGALAGSFRFTSTASSSRIAIEFKTDLYGSETWATDGQEVEIGYAQPLTNSRSALGLFLWMNKAIVGEGLLGGVLNARWPLLDVAGRRAKLSYDGVKKIGGRELHRLRYRAREKQGTLDVLIFLEPETYRHAGTIYTSSQAAGMGLTPETSSQQQELVFRLEEWFSDFERFGSIALPKVWTLSYERAGNTTSEWKYELRLENYEERDIKSGAPARSARRGFSGFLLLL